MYWIGIDLGTSAVKTLLMDENGRIRKTAARAYPLEIPRPGWSQQNPADWEDAVFDAIPELIREIDAGEVAGIGVGGQMHGLVALDRNDAVLRPAILWNDGRTAKETAWLNQEIGRARLSAWTGNIAFAGFTAPKLLWMRANEPDLFGRIEKILLPKDYIVHRLTGAYTTDFSDASGTLLLDVQNRRWSEEMLQICGVRESQLPELRESYETAGTLTPEAAARTGLPAGVRVCAGAGDNAAAAIGTGTVGEGRCNLSIGTSGTVFISSRQFRIDPHNALHAFAHADGHYHLMGCMLSAAACNGWWSGKILQTDDFSAEQKGIPEDRLGSNPVFFLPYLMGERSPHNDPDARGLFLGLSLATTRADMTQAVLEGVAFGIRDSLEVARSLGIAVQRSTICGGGAKSPLWREIFANVLNMGIDTVATEEGPGFGAAILAAVNCGAYPSVQAAAEKLVRISGSTEPCMDIAARYEEQYAAFRSIYPAVKPLFERASTKI